MEVTLRLVRSRRLLVVGIGGCSRSGKTTLSRTLLQSLQAQGHNAQWYGCCS